MEEKLKGFFDIASRKAETVAAAAQARVDEEAARKAAIVERRRKLDAAVDAELGPIFNALKALPPKDGKAFVVIDRDWHSTPSRELGRMIRVKYKVPDDWDHDVTHEDAYIEPMVTLFAGYKRRGRLGFEATQNWTDKQSWFHRDWHNLHVAGRSFGFLRRQLAKGLAEIAPDRIAEIGEKLNAAPGDGSISVFRKPLQFTTQHRPFWKRWADMTPHNPWLTF
jgi:hypothetical protein